MPRHTSLGNEMPFMVECMGSMSLVIDFQKALEESIEYKGHLEEGHSNYYSAAYAEPIKAYFAQKNVLSYETAYNARFKCVPICAFASSARLCYLHFRSLEEQGEPLFEALLDNDIPCNSVPTHMDVIHNNVYYECKCQEILSTSKSPFSVSYLRSPLFQELGIQETKSVRKEVEQHGKVSISYILEFPLSQLGISYNDDPDYANLHFDLKQLISHLLAIANTKGNEEATLAYVFYTPKPSSIEAYESVKELYETLNKEWDAIFAEGTAIHRFIHNHNIKVLREYVDISTIRDFNYEEAYLGN